MRVTISSLVLFLYCAASAQLPVIQLFQNQSTGIPGPDSITGIEYWWRASDLNSTFISSTIWTDRIQSKGFKSRTDASIAVPAVTSVSLTFAGNSQLTNTIKNMVSWPGSNNTFRTFVMCVKPTAGHTGANQCWFGPTDDTDTGIAFLTGPKLTYNNGFTFSPSAQGNGNIQDWVWIQTNLSTTTIGIDLYTNNVLSATPGSNPANLGKILYTLGGNGANFLWANVYEIVVYTNASRKFNSTELTTLHTYFTNTYTFAP